MNQSPDTQPEDDLPSLEDHGLSARSAHMTGILEGLPTVPGIYIMKDGHDGILYIGKAKNLRNRVRSYFQNARALPPRTRIFIGKVRDIKILTTATETEALILESNFIKKHQPRYNVLLKDDKHYPYLRLTTQEPYPRLEVVRKIKKDGATYFGPYTMVKEVRETIRMIYKIFPLRQSRDPLNGEAVRRPCLNHQMGRCLAPCAAKVTPEDYARVVRDVTFLLKGRNRELLDSLKEKMELASAELQFEQAAVYRDKIAAVKTVIDRQKIISTSLEDRDVIGYAREAQLATAQVLVIRGGKMSGEKIFKLKNTGQLEEADPLSAFLKQYYADEELLPKTILLPHSIEDAGVISDWLSQKKGGRVKLEVPQMGKNRDLVRMAEENARFALRTEIDKADVSTRSLEELQDSLELRALPEVIEGFDISNISGSYAVGSMVYFHQARPDKAKYRRYQIKEVRGIDDYGMLREVVLRRYKRLLQEKAPLPNLVLIDGGRGHLNTAHKALQELGLDQQMDLVCVAKGKNRNNLATDEVLLVHKQVPVLFRENSPSRYLLQRVRDEAHRFAITYHRRMRNQKTLASPLEAIPGIGKKRRLLLLKQFGSLENIKKATVEELKAVPGITDPLARKIFSVL